MKQKSNVIGAIEVTERSPTPLLVALARDGTVRTGWYRVEEDPNCPIGPRLRFVAGPFLTRETALL